MIDDIQRSVEKLLQTELFELVQKAEPFIDYCLKRGLERKQNDLIEWAFSSLLRMLYLLDKSPEILEMEIPEVEDSKNLKNSLGFYKSLVFLRTDDIQKIKEASAFFKKIIERNKNNIGYKINLINSLIRQVELSEEQELLKEEIQSLANTLEKEIFEKDSLEYKLLIENILYYYKIRRDFIAFNNCYNGLKESVKNSYTIAVFAIQVNIELDNINESRSILDKLVLLYEEDDLLQRLKNDITKKTNSVQKRPTLDTDINWLSTLMEIKNALNAFSTLSANKQAKVYFGNNNMFKKDIIAYQVFQAIKSMDSLAPILNRYDSGRIKQGYEDDYNELFCQILNQRVHLFGWTCTTQNRGGYAKKGIGERDIVIYKNGKEIAIIEAMRLQTTNKNNIMEHVRKLFSYDPERTSLYFLILWGFTDNPELSFNKYREVIRTWNEGDWSIIGETLPGETFFSLEPDDFPPLAICTHHKPEYKEEILMTHIFVDIKQQSRRNNNK